VYDPGENRMMARALELAGRALGKTSPNPLVGAVLVKQGRKVGEGYHRYAGAPHAEIVALRKAGKKARGATLFVNLEPCFHHGRTPPCVDAIIRSGIRRVVAAMRDPNPLVRGRGINALRRAGIKVEVGLMRTEAGRLNEIFIHHITSGTPFVALKMAQSLDGAIASAPGVRTAITSSPALRLTHSLRSRHDAVMVGISTVLADDPLLNVRGVRGAKQPARVILDSQLNIPLDSRLVATAAQFPTLVLYDPVCSAKGRMAALAQKKVELAPVEGASGGILPPRAVLGVLAGRGITSVLIEGGKRVATSFLREEAVQRLHLFIAPLLMGEGGPLHCPGDLGQLSKRLRLRDLQRLFLGPDIYLTGRLN
jgi:diaminohydroxyphosphoribosylaminopyrimidine deaminase/5-amino-6-(5-phosphoribosylamino)uracil reductase